MQIQIYIQRNTASNYLAQTTTYTDTWYSFTAVSLLGVVSAGSIRCTVLSKLHPLFIGFCHCWRMTGFIGKNPRFCWAKNLNWKKTEDLWLVLALTFAGLFSGEKENTYQNVWEKDGGDFKRNIFSAQTKKQAGEKECASERPKALLEKKRKKKRICWNELQRMEEKSRCLEVIERDANTKGNRKGSNWTKGLLVEAISLVKSDRA